MGLLYNNTIVLAMLLHRFDCYDVSLIAKKNYKIFPTHGQMIFFFNLKPKQGFPFCIYSKIWKGIWHSVILQF